MDAVGLIVTALAAGAAVGVKSATEQAMKDAYAGLKELIIRRYGDRKDVADALETLEKKPDSEGRRSVLREELEQTNAGNDDTVLEAAQTLLEKIDPETRKHFQVTATDHSVAIGGGVGRSVTNIHGNRVR